MTAYPKRKGTVTMTSALDLPLCVHCEGKSKWYGPLDPAHKRRHNFFVVVKERPENLDCTDTGSNPIFCSLECAEEFLKRCTPPEEAVAVSVSYPTNEQLALHFVVRRKKRLPILRPEARENE